MQPFNILIVEDNKGDVFMMTEAFEDAGVSHKYVVVNDGKEALDFLFKKSPFENVDLPDIILLDLNIPKFNGFEVLNIVKRSEQLKAIPVIIFSTSSSETDILSCYKAYANCYIVKPQEAKDFVKAIAKIEEFWTTHVTLPTYPKL